MYEEKQWYVVNTYSGHESKVKEKLEMRIQSMDMQNYIFRVIVPETTEVEIKDGKRKEKVKKMFPGYVLVEMIMTDEAWFVVRNTPGVTGFLGSSGKGAKPFPLFPHEIDEAHHKVKITDGPFALMAGTVDEIDKENSKAKVNIDLFGQETSVEVELTQIELDK